MSGEAATTLPVLVHLSNILIYVINCIPLSVRLVVVRPSVLCCKALMLDIVGKLKQIVFIPGMLIGTIDHYHFIPFSAALIMAEGHKVSRKHSVVASFLTYC